MPDNGLEVDQIELPPAQTGHYVRAPLEEGPGGCHAHAGGEHAIEGRGAAAPLDVPKLGDPRLVADAAVLQELCDAISPW
jgi:hypothetical protein